MRAVRVLVLVLVTLAALPTAAALVVPVPDSNQGTHDFGVTTATAWSYAFNSNYFDLNNGNSSDAITYSNVIVNYDVTEARGGLWSGLNAGGGVGQWITGFFGVQPAEAREYVTSFTWNSTAWINMTTTFTLGLDRHDGPFLWHICNHVDYTYNGTQYSATKECDSNYWGGSPNKITHFAHFGNISVGSLDQNGVLVEFQTDESTDQAFDSYDLGVPLGTPPPAAPLYTHSVSVDARGISGDEFTLSETHLFPKNTNVAAIENGLIVPSCNGFDCMMIQAISSVFGLMGRALAGLFNTLSFGGPSAQNPGDTAATIVTSIAALLIGAPITLLALVLSHPGKTAVAITDYALILGIVRFGTSTMVDASVMWEYPIRMWIAIGKGVVAFAKWFYGVAEAMFAAMMDANPWTLLIVAGALAVSTIIALIVHLGGH